MGENNGGFGGFVSAVVPVTPGQLLYVYVYVYVYVGGGTQGLEECSG